MTERVLVKNAASEKQTKRAVDVEALERRREEDDIRFVMGDLRGRRFVWRLLSKCGENKISYVPGTQDALNNALYYEGGRNIGLEVKASIVAVDQEAYFTMMREAADADIKFKGEKDDAGKTSRTDADTDPSA